MTERIAVAGTGQSQIVAFIHRHRWHDSADVCLALPMVVRMAMFELASGCTVQVGGPCSSAA
eukprot:2599798-Alexandrium_andersonii.AAC.1